VQLFSPASSAWYHADALFIIDIWIWLLLAVAIGVSKRREQKGREWRRLPQVSTGLTVTYIGLNLLITQRADAAVRGWAGGRPITALFASPPPVAFWRRDLVWREGDCYRRSHFDPLGGGFQPVSTCSPTRMNDPLVRQAIRRDPALRRFLKWSVLPQADSRREGCFVKVSIGDARYGEGRRSRLARESVLRLSGPGC
jgi:inner membrane protein